MSIPAMDKVRAAIQGLCPNRKSRVTYGQLYELFGIGSKQDKERLRLKVKDMVRRGELKRVEPGVFTYHPNAISREAAEGHRRIWRAIRASQPGWKAETLVQITRMTYSHVRKYCKWLAQEGYITRHGRDGNTYLWRATAKARAQREAPIPSRAPKDPFNTERNAACRLARALMNADPYQPAVRKKIITECQTILSRFAPAEEATK